MSGFRCQVIGVLLTALAVGQQTKAQTKVDPESQVMAAVAGEAYLYMVIPQAGSMKVVRVLLDSSIQLVAPGAVPGDYRLKAVASGGSTVLFMDEIVPVGTLDGVNRMFALPTAPNPVGSLQLTRNGLRLKSGTDYTLGGNTITFLAGVATPRAGDLLVAWYRQ